MFRGGFFLETSYINPMPLTFKRRRPHKESFIFSLSLSVRIPISQYSIPGMQFFLILIILFLELTTINCHSVRGAIGDPGEVEAFFDEWLVEKMESNHVPGAVVAVVKDGKTTLLKGYGYADLKEQKTMDPAKTLIRVGSISKLVTATAALQLFERNLLDLNTDVRDYIEADIIAAYNDSITVHHLLTHTGGLGERFYGQTVKDSADLLPLGLFLGQEMPPPLADPGAVINYSNYGISLIGYVAEKISGQSYATYAQENIFKPLGMINTNYIPTPDRDSEVATGYNYVFGGYRNLPRGHWKPYPASSLVTTAQDMARFMIGHLNYDSMDETGGERKLFMHAKTNQYMHQEHHTLNPHLPGIAYGFWIYEENGQRVLWHTGHMPGHRSALILIPEHRFGIFLNYNADPKFLNEYLSALLQRIFPAERAEIQTSNKSSDGFNASLYTGSYRHNWYPRTSPGKACALVGIQGKEIKVKNAGNGALFIDGILSLPIGTSLFKQITNNKSVAFIQGDEDGSAHLYFGGVEVYNKIKWFETVWFHRGLIAGLILFFAFSALIFFILIIKSRKQKDEKGNSPTPTGVWQFAFLVAAFPVVFFVGIFVLTSFGAYKMVEEMPKVLYVILSVPFFNFAACAGLIYQSAKMWTNTRFRRGEKTLVMLILISSLVFAWGLDHWNYLGYHF